MHRSRSISIILLMCANLLVCALVTVPRVEAHIEAEAHAAVARFPDATVQADGRRVLLSGVSRAGGNSALAERRLQAIPGLCEIEIKEVPDP